MSNGSRKGEHVFNAFGGLVDDLIKELRTYMNWNGERESVKAAWGALCNLEYRAIILKRERENEAFRTAKKGDEGNSGTYSAFCVAVRATVIQLLSGDEKSEKGDLFELMHLSGFIRHAAIDKTAHDAKLKEDGVDKKAFKRWFSNTGALMDDTFDMLVNTAKAIKKTQ